MPPPPEPLKFTKARFESAHADPPANPEARERRRHAYRERWTPPALIPECWIVSRDYEFWSESEGRGDRFVVPAGFDFDGASVPWPLTVLVPRTHPIYLGAAALHDYLYARRHGDVGRSRADALFLTALLVSGLNWFWAGLIWRSVRAAGWAVWWKHKPETPLGRLLTRGWWIVRWPAIVLGTAVLGVGGILYDIFYGAWAVRRQAAAIRAADG